jgi:hypothetical protein
MGYLMKVYLKSIGIDALVMEKWYSEAVAESKVRFISSCKFEEAIVIAKRILNEATGFKVNVYSVSPLTVIIDGDESLKGFLNMMLYTFSAIIRRLSGTNLCAEPKEEHQVDGVTRFKTVFESSEDLSSCRTIKRNEEMQRFAILEKDRWTKVLTNDIQIDVLKFISECPVSMQEIISCFDTPRSTLSYNIGKMMEDGLLEFRVDENGVGRYHSNYHIFLMTSTSSKRYSGIEAITERYGFMDGYLRFVAS